EAVFGDQAVRELARKARERLLDRVSELYEAELLRFDDAVASLGVDPDQAPRLSAAGEAVRRTR
ncbi:MAG: ABC transporter, partial [Terracoccus sp.]